jgi:hypothetical protein
VLLLVPIFDSELVFLPKDSLRTLSRFCLCNSELCSFSRNRQVPIFMCEDHFSARSNQQFFFIKWYLITPWKVITVDSLTMDFYTYYEINITKPITNQETIRMTSALTKMELTHHEEKPSKIF